MLVVPLYDLAKLILLKLAFILQYPLSSNGYVLTNSFSVSLNAIFGIEKEYNTEPGSFAHTVTYNSLKLSGNVIGFAPVIEPNNFHCKLFCKLA